MNITLVTGNPNKLKEWQRLIPDNIVLNAADIDLEEIQSLDLEAIAIDKAKRAYKRIGGPVLVEDISAGLVSLNGLPGPFIKFFEIELGEDALYKLARKTGEAAIVTCVIAYYDSKKSFTARADIKGQVVSSRGDNGFGFDKVFRPNGSDKTFGEMTVTEKDTVSHRANAIKIMTERLTSSL